jgi:hypothetical protein
MMMIRLTKESPLRLLQSQYAPIDYRPHRTQGGYRIHLQLPIHTVGSRLPDIFLSYSHEDERTAKQFAESFEREGISVSVQSR